MTNLNAAHDELDQLLRSAAPVQDATLAGSAEVRQALSGMVQATVLEPRPEEATPVAPFRRPRPARRRRTVAGLSAVSAVWALTATGVAAAGGYALYSGFTDSPTSTESVPGEEYVNVAAADFGPAFDRIAERHPLPAGADYDRLHDAIVDTGGLAQLTGVAGEVVIYNSCAWAGEWVQAHDAADTAAEQTAVTALEQAAGSSDLAAIDGGGVVASVTSIAQAAGAGDAVVVADYVASADCSTAGR